MSTLRIAALALPAAVLLGGCSDDSSPCDALVSEVSIRNAAGDETSSFADGELVTVRAVVTNVGDKPASISIDAYQSCGPVYVDVADAGGARLWAGACPPGHLCLCASDHVTLEPGESIAPEDSWDQRLSNGDLAPAGTYSGRGIDATECAPLLNDGRSFTLVR